jgi:hypothetical protein
VFLICKACVDGFDYYTIALIAISFCGAGKRDCPRWTIKFRRWKARSFLESFFFFFFSSLSLIEAGNQLLLLLFSIQQMIIMLLRNGGLLSKNWLENVISLDSCLGGKCTKC